jgi:geranylgeranyl diphosphate synthase type II
MSDTQNNKSTFVTMYGIEKCRQIIAQQTQKAKESIRGKFENTDFLEWFAEYLAQRKY